MTRHYIGRFAPSPSGPLHFGSILTATASFLDARAHAGQWLVRIEDIDPPRERPGAAAAIQHQLEAHGLHWDGAVLYQSARTPAYEEALNTLINRGLCYECECSRARVQALPEGYDGKCRPRRLTRLGAVKPGVAVRLIVDSNMPPRYVDLFRGPQELPPGPESRDFLLRRRDGLWSYQLAVCVDDGFQNITHVVRGGDLLASTPGQIYLHRALECAPRRYGHVPLVLGDDGRKLSKQNQAVAVDSRSAHRTLYRVLEWLGQAPPDDLRAARVPELLAWATTHWRREPVLAIGATVAARHGKE